MTAADPFSWPEDRRIAQLRAERDTANAKVRAVQELILKYRGHASHGGLVPSCRIINAWLEIDENRP